MLTCYFCGATADSVGSAIDADWVPAFWDGERHVDCPACADCAKSRLQLAADGEMEMKPL